MSKHRKHTVRRLTLLILLSAACTIISTWGLSMVCPRRFDQIHRGVLSDDEEFCWYGICSMPGWYSVITRHWHPSDEQTANLDYYWNLPEARIPGWAKPCELPIFGKEDDWQWARYYEAYGFPLLAMRGSYLLRDDGQGSEEYASRVDGVPISDFLYGPTSQARALPLVPVWPGFLINTVIFAALLFTIRLVYVTIKRRSRRKRGLCIQCAYNLSGGPHEQCPECGAAIRP